MGKNRYERIECPFCHKLVSKNRLPIHTKTLHNEYTSSFALKLKLNSETVEKICKLWKQSLTVTEISEQIQDFDYQDVYNVINLKFSNDEVKERSCVQKNRASIKTNLYVYGVKHHMKLESQREKVWDTLESRYGVRRPMQSNVIYRRVQDTFLKKYNVEFLLQSQIIKDRVRKTNLEKYGVTCVFQLVRVYERTHSKKAREKKKLDNRLRMQNGTHNFYKVCPWGVEKQRFELLFDQECRKRGLDPLDVTQGWDCPPVTTWFNGDRFVFQNSIKSGLKADRINRKHRIWIEIDEEDHRKTRAYDFARDEFCRKHNWTVIRIFWKRLYNEVYMNRIVDKIQRSLKGDFVCHLELARAQIATV
jgi:very-short-patch-repair endonuclease